MMDKINKTLGEWLVKDKTLTVQDIQLVIPKSIGEEHNLLSCPFLLTEHGRVSIAFSHLPNEGQIFMADMRIKKPKWLEAADKPKFNPAGLDRLYRPSASLSSLNKLS